jgi:hypothetical protein
MTLLVRAIGFDARYIGASSGDVEATALATIGRAPST